MKQKAKTYKDYLKESKDPSLKFYQDKLGKHSGLDFGLYTIGDGVRRRNREYKKRKNEKAHQSLSKIS